VRARPPDQSAELLERVDGLAVSARRLDLVDEELEDQVLERIDLARL
jgi:hypothetical protein